MLQFPRARTPALTRRTFVGGGACAVASLGVEMPVSAAVAGLGPVGGRLASNDVRGPAGLYAFPGKRVGTTVVAATWVESGRRAQGSGESSVIRLHVGSRTWEVEASSHVQGGKFARDRHIEIYSGAIASTLTQADERLMALVLEGPTKEIAGSKSLSVWAERFQRDGERVRIGSPFLADIVADDPALGEAYHSIRPEADRAMLLEKVADAVSSRARRSGRVASPELHGLRLASKLLPDSLNYDPTKPNGFTFAAQNGRHPSEDTIAVVHTILNGTISPSSSKSGIALQDGFPYFVPSTTFA